MDYVVKPGDTLSGILTSITGDGSYDHYTAVAAQNGIANPNLIRVGQVIHIDEASISPEYRAANNMTTYTPSTLGTPTVRSASITSGTSTVPSASITSETPTVPSAPITSGTPTISSAPITSGTGGSSHVGALTAALAANDVPGATSNPTGFNGTSGTGFVSAEEPGYIEVQETIAPFFDADEPVTDRAPIIDVKAGPVTGISAQLGDNDMIPPTADNHVAALTAALRDNDEMINLGQAGILTNPDGVDFVDDVDPQAMVYDGTVTTEGSGNDSTSHEGGFAPEGGYNFTSVLDDDDQINFNFDEAIDYLEGTMDADLGAIVLALATLNFRVSDVQNRQYSTPESSIGQDYLDFRALLEAIADFTVEANKILDDVVRYVHACNEIIHN